MPVDAPDDELRRRALERAGIEESALRRLKIARRSVDARRTGGRRRLRFIVHVDLSVDAGYTSKRFAAARKSGQLTEAPPREHLTVAALPAGPPR